MAGEIVTKKITELEENTTIDDADILMAGDKGTNALKRFTIGAFLTAIKAKLAAWTFDTLQTTSKTLPGAVNELNSKSAQEYHPEFWTYHASVKNKSDDVQPVVGYIGKIAFLHLYFDVLNTGGTSMIGYIDSTILPRFLTVSIASNTDGKSYPVIVHPDLNQVYSDIILPEGTYAISAMWVINN